MAICKPQFDQSTASGGATVVLNSDMTYTVTIPNDTISAVDRLYFGNIVDVGGGNEARRCGTSYTDVPQLSPSG
jgi:hypothetical protein